MLVDCETEVKTNTTKTRASVAFAPEDVRCTDAHSRSDILHET